MEQKQLKLGLFPKPHMFTFGQKGIVVEKERHAVCVYATDADHHHIYAAVPLGAPKNFRREVFRIGEAESNPAIAIVSVGDLRMVFDFEQKLCTVNARLPVYGSDAWGETCGVAWNDAFNALF